MNNDLTNLIPSTDSYLLSDIRPSQLPPFLARALSITDSPEQRDMLFLAALSACSYALPNVHMLHGKPNRTYFPNLMTLIVAPPASGKGIMNRGKTLLSHIHNHLAHLDRQAIIPANCSSSAFIDLLESNGGNAFMMETEMDVLTGTWKNDYSNYSYIFRQAFEHEDIMRARKSTKGLLDNKHIPSPRLSVLLSGTLNQLAPLLASRENGLASRFMPYIVDDIAPFDAGVFQTDNNSSSDNADLLYDELSRELFWRWQWLLMQEHPATWRLTPEQEKQMADFFSDGYVLAFEGFQMPESFAATIKRMAVIIKRIGLILTALRLNTSSSLPSVIYCSDTDFRTLLILTEKLLRHAANMMLLLPEEKPAVAPSAPRRTTKATNLLDLLPDRFTTAEALEIGEKIGITDRTVMTWLKKYTDEKLIKRISQGRYRRL